MPCSVAIAAPPATLPKTIAERGAGETSTDCRNPSLRSSMSDIAEKIDVNRTIRRTIPGIEVTEIARLPCLRAERRAEPGADHDPEDERSRERADDAGRLPEESDELPLRERERGSDDPGPSPRRSSPRVHPAARPAEENVLERRPRHRDRAAAPETPPPGAPRPRRRGDARRPPLRRARAAFHPRRASIPRRELPGSPPRTRDEVPSDRGASAPSGVSNASRRPRSTRPTRSADSASSVRWVVYRMVAPLSARSAAGGVPEIAARGGIEPDRGLVQKQDPRPREERPREIDPPGEPAGELLDLLAPALARHPSPRAPARCGRRAPRGGCPSGAPDSRRFSAR